MTDIVERTLRQWRQSRFEYGRADCLLSVGEYMARCGGQDVASWFRGRYDTEAEAEAFVVEYGGLHGLIDLVGFPRINPLDVKRGDVVVVDPGKGLPHLAGLCTGGDIAMRTLRSVFLMPVKRACITHAWGVRE